MLYYNIMSAQYLQQTVDARASSDTFEIATVAKTLTAGETVQFDVLQSNLDGRENIIVSMSGYSGSFLADGTPIVFLQKIDSGNNKFTVGIKNIAVSQSTGSQVYVLRVTVIRGST